MSTLPLTQEEIAKYNTHLRGLSDQDLIRQASVNLTLAKETRIEKRFEAERLYTLKAEFCFIECCRRGKPELYKAAERDSWMNF